MSLTDKAIVLKRIQSLSHRSDEIKGKVAHSLRHLWTPERPLHPCPPAHVFKALKQLFPNFSEYLDYCALVAQIGRKLNGEFKCPPVLLIGPPGLGKTFFVSQAAKAFGLPYYEQGLSTASAGFVLAGLALGWGEGGPGFVAESLASSPVANPIFLIDEIDKSTDSRYDPLGPLYPLLESHSAKHFRDEALEIPIDTSHVNWVATANEIDRIPAPILSRMKTFHIDLPKEAEMPSVVESIYVHIRQEEMYGSLLAKRLSPEVLGLFHGLSPRAAKRAVSEAAMNAIRAGRRQVLPRDVNLPLNPNSRQHKPGFY